MLFSKFGSAWNVDRPTVELADGLQLMAEDLGTVRGWVESGGGGFISKLLRPGLQIHVSNNS